MMTVLLTVVFLFPSIATAAHSPPTPYIIYTVEGNKKHVYDSFRDFAAKRINCETCPTDDFRGTLCQEESENPETYERSQYVKALVGIS